MDLVWSTGARSVPIMSIWAGEVFDSVYLSMSDLTPEGKTSIVISKYVSLSPKCMVVDS